jgi:hypothetical protein
MQTGGSITGYRGTGGKFVNPQQAVSQIITYLGGQSYDVGAASRLHSGAALSPGQRGVVQVDIDLYRYNAALTKFLLTFSNNMAKVVRAHALELLSRVQQRCPVRTGRLRASMHAVMPNSSSDRYSYTDKQGHGFDGSLEGARTGPLEAAVGTNVIYAPAMESGGSRQAPNGMFAVSVREMAGELEQEIARELGAAWQGAD